MEVPKQIEVAIELAQRTAVGRGKIATFAKEMARLLGEARTQILNAEAVSPVDRRVDDHGAKTTIYSVEKRGHEEMLVEKRTSGTAKPFRCSQKLYNSVAKTLVEAEKPLSVQDIADGIEKLTGDRHEEFRVRVVLRFWLQVSPPVVTRHRARYRVTSRDMQGDAQALWDTLSK